MARLTLNDHLFEVLEDLTDKSLKGEELKEQMCRADATAKIAQQIIASNNFALKAALAAINNGIMDTAAKAKLKQLAE